MNALVVITTAPALKAEKIAKALIKRRLAACVQIDPVTSLYRWKGKVERAHEMRLTIKTRAELYGPLETAIRALTPYETPEIIAHPVVAGSADYLEWIAAETGRAMADAALDIRGLRKAFDKKVAVDDLNLQVRAGELYALLGPNGAGKTTTLRMVTGLLRPDAGSIGVFGVNALAEPVAAKRMIAWLPDEPMLYDKLTPMEYLEFIAGLWGVDVKAARERAEQLLKMLELWDNRDQRCEGFSRGMKQKASLAGALVHDPKLLILDEPLTGLDAAIARQVKNLLQQRVKEGATVILTTHILEVAERMADRIGVIQRGKLIAQGTLAELRAAHGGANETLEDLFLEMTGQGDETAPA